VVVREKKYEEILLFSFITCKIPWLYMLHDKLFEDGYYVMAQMGLYMGSNVYVIVGWPSSGSTWEMSKNMYI
jgi:hypothetical protein